MSPLRMLVISLMAHVVVAGVVPSPWWTPNLTLVGAILAITHAPTRWFTFSGLAGLWMMVWAIRFPAPVLMSYLLLGWIAQLLARHWDTTDLRVQCVMVGVGSLLTTLELLWLDDLWSLPLLGWVSVQVMVTALALPCTRYLRERLPKAIG